MMKALSFVAALALAAFVGSSTLVAQDAPKAEAKKEAKAEAAVYAMTITGL